MDFENVEKYFRDYIKTYIPYSERPFYSSLIDFLVNVYLKNIYENIPSDFKTLFEINNVTPNLYGVILKSLGVPDNVNHHMTSNEKFRFLRALSDFYKYKGTIRFFEKVATNFYESFNIYELYIDQDELTNRWIFKPKPIYKYNDENDIPDYIYYNEVYGKIPSLLVSEEQLESLKSSGSIILPIKSNVILLEYDFIDEVIEILDLIIMSFLKEYGKEKLKLIFDDSEFIVDLKSLYFIWYYILIKYMKTKWNNNVNIIQLSTIDNAYSLDEMNIILEKYSKINNNIDKDIFFENYINPKTMIYKITERGEKRSLDDQMKFINIEFYNYMVSHLTDKSNDEINRFLREIFDSLINFAAFKNNDETFSRYFEYFIHGLPKISTNASETTSYFLLYNFKPYEVEFLDKTLSGVRSNEYFSITDNMCFDTKIIDSEFVFNLDEEISNQTDISITDDLGLYDATLVYD
jgi:hypothetical protein